MPAGRETGGTRPKRARLPLTASFTLLTAAHGDGRYRRLLVHHRVQGGPTILKSNTEMVVKSANFYGVTCDGENSCTSGIILMTSDLCKQSIFY